MTCSQHLSGYGILRKKRCWTGSVLSLQTGRSLGSDLPAGWGALSRHLRTGGVWERRLAVHQHCLRRPDGDNAGQGQPFCLPGWPSLLETQQACEFGLHQGLACGLYSSLWMKLFLSISSFRGLFCWQNSRSLYWLWSGIHEAGHCGLVLAASLCPEIYSDFQLQRNTASTQNFNPQIETVTQSFGIFFEYCNLSKPSSREDFFKYSHPYHSFLHHTAMRPHFTDDAVMVWNMSQFSFYTQSIITIVLLVE